MIQILGCALWALLGVFLVVVSASRLLIYYHVLKENRACTADPHHWAREACGIMDGGHAPSRLGFGILMGIANVCSSVYILRTEVLI